MNAATLALVDPLPAQLAIDERRRHIHRFVGSTVIPLDQFGWSLRLSWFAKETPVGVGASRGFLGVEHDIQITETQLVSACGLVRVLPPGFVSRDKLCKYQHEIEERLDRQQWEGSGL